MTAIDPERIRADFPIFADSGGAGAACCYLDNAASTQKPRQVIEAVADFERHAYANVHRGIYKLSSAATERYEQVRGIAARFIHAREQGEIVFTHGATEAINLVAYSWGKRFVNAGDEIIVSEMEHHSNLIPWQLLAREKGARLLFIPVKRDGSRGGWVLDLERYREMLSPRTRLVAVTHVSNVLGARNDVAAITRAAHEVGARVLADGAQSAAHMRVDVTAIGCDFFVFSGHKMLAPTGTGVLYGRREVLEEMGPFMTGGEMVAEVEKEYSTWAEVPHRFEAGTPNISGVIGLGAAIEYLDRLGMEEIERHVRRLADLAQERAAEDDRLEVFRGPAGDAAGIISYRVGFGGRGPGSPRSPRPPTGRRPG